MLLAKCMEELRKHGKVHFDIHYIVMNPGYRSDIYQQILKNAEILGIDIKIFDSNIFEVVDNQDSSPCYLCARMRRGFYTHVLRNLAVIKLLLGTILMMLLKLFYCLFLWWRV